MNKLFNRLGHLIEDKRVLILVISLVLLVGAMAGASRLGWATGLETMVSSDSETYQQYQEFNSYFGSETLIMRKPETWAAALDYTIRKVNLRPVTRQGVADFYGISDGAVRDRHMDLVRTLDVMPCDYRYFVGKENPLDKLVEAAELLEQLEIRFQEP